MPPQSSTLWHCARNARTQQIHHVRLAIRPASTASPSRKQPPAPPKTEESPPSSFNSSELPPESPKFIFIPQPPQPDRFVPRRMKGLLPRPRHPFKSKKDRDSPASLAAATPEPSTSHEPPAHLPASARAHILAKASLAAQRRAHLRSGTVELRARYMREQKHADARAAEHRADHERRLHAPEREDERLTASTVRATTTPKSAALQEDPLAAERLAARRARYDGQQALKRDRRADAMHILYQNAGNFIVDEKGLSEAVEDAFETPFYRANPDRGIWDAEGFPENLGWLIAQQATRKAQYAAALGQRGDGTGMEPDDRLLKRGRQRVDRMVELLTRPVAEGAEEENEKNAGEKKAEEA